MFGRHDSDDYEEYNQRQNAKYDDDYIRDTEEYREECHHSHEQTYRDYDTRSVSDYDVRSASEEYREECSHSHEQTYEDFNSEQRVYDERSKEEAKFTKYLKPNEHIIWSGKTEKTATPEETQTQGCGCAAAFMIGAGVLMLFSMMAMFGIMLLMFGAVIMSSTSVKRRSYAITDERVLTLVGSSLRSVPLRQVRGVHYKSSKRGIGSVTYVKGAGSQISTSLTDGIFGIKDPETVCRILQNAAASAKSIQGVR